VAKTAVGKVSPGGRKTAFRELDADGRATREVVTLDGAEPPGPRAARRSLQVDVMRRGSVVHRPSLDEVRAHHAAIRAELPANALEIAHGEPALTAVPTGEVTR
jgi:nicotinate phosphoribosyltransferase